MKNKKVFKILAVLLAIMLVAVAVTACSAKIDWDSLKKDDVVLTVKDSDISLTKGHVVFHYIEADESLKASKLMFEQMGLEEFGKDMEASMEISYNAVATYAALAKAAEDAGLAISMEDAEEIAFTEYVLNVKLGYYQSVGDYTKTIREELGITEDEMVEIATTLRYIRKNAENFMGSIYDAYKAENLENFKELDEDVVAKAVLDQCKEAVKNIEVMAQVPNEHSFNCDMEKIVTDYVSYRKTSLTSEELAEEAEQRKKEKEAEESETTEAENQDDSAEQAE